MADKTKGQELKEKLFYKKRSTYDVYDEARMAAAFEYAKGYAEFIDAAKTEREAVRYGISMLEKAGFTEYKIGGEIKAGGKYYLNNRSRALYAFKVGTEPIENGVRIAAAHVDSPRLDLKQHPLYEDNGFAYFKTHYYGGIRKYQWVTIPLALHGVVTRADGTTVEVVIGEDESDPVFVITDLLPHLAKDQNGRTLGSAFTGEGLNIIVGGMPYRDDAADEKVKLNVMAALNEKYGITESDFISAELTAVPAGKSRDIGLDRALLGAYGHDDRVCAYPELTALIECADSVHTNICILADKEETGSEGVSGMKCNILADLITELSRCLEGNENVVRDRSMCLSADVAAGFDPLYPDVLEKRNSAIMGSGTVLEKFTGSGGKGGTNEASAEYMGKIRAMLDADDVVWQTAELGKVDQGGGGTVAMYISKLNIDTVDLGVPVLSMHAPFEVIAKTDLYETHRALVAFYK